MLAVCEKSDHMPTRMITHSSLSVGTYGGLNNRTSTFSARRGRRGSTRLHRIGSKIVYTDMDQPIEFATVNGWMNVICSSGFSGCLTCVRINVSRYDNYELRSMVVSQQASDIIYAQLFSWPSKLDMNAETTPEPAL